MHAARQRAVTTANVELVTINWTIGKTILDRQARAGWGAKVMDRLAVDLRAEFPEMKGLTRSGLHRMRAVAAAFPGSNVPTVLGHLSWSHIVLLVEKLDEPGLRELYAAAATQNGWSLAVLRNQVMSQYHLRAGGALSNFHATLPAADSELMQEITKDPYVFEFLDVNRKLSERELEDQLMTKVQHLLLELGQGFSLAGRQYRFTAGSKEFFIDLLFFHIERNCYVVVELKIEEFSPSHVGQLGMYVSWVDENLRRKHHEPTVGLLICADKDNHVVRYSLQGIGQPLAVSSFTYDSLPAGLRNEHPEIAEVLDAVETPRGPRQLPLFEEFGVTHSSDNS